MLHLYFAPLEGITTYPYRNLHHKYFGGVDKYFTPFLAPGPEQGMSVKEMVSACRLRAHRSRPDIRSHNIFQALPSQAPDICMMG